MKEYPTRSYPYRPLPDLPSSGVGPGSGPPGGPPELKARLVGVDPDAGRALTSGEFARLADPFALLVLKRDKFPKTLRELIDILDADPAGLPAQRVFIVSEWGQIPLTGATQQFRRGLRYAIARGKAGAPGADLLISAPPPSDSAEVFLQVAGWDSVNEVFHYYERGEGGATWFWEGDSWHALTAPTRGKGPFDSHVNGAPVMKELKEPWLHWSSIAQEIVRENFPPAHPVQRANETSLFNTGQSAHLLQLQIVQPGVRRWTTARMRRVLAEPQGITDPEALLRQLLTSTTVNIASAKERSRSTEPEIRIPETMFADVDTLVDILLPDANINTVTIPRPIYEQAVAAQQLALRDTQQGFTQPGDTFFAWPVPERGFEDIVVVQALVQRGVLSAQFATALLMIDFSNPIDSPRRAALMRHVPQGPIPATGAQGLQIAMMRSIEAAAAAEANAADEAEILQIMRLPDGEWQSETKNRISALFTAVAARAKSLDGAIDYLKLADWRRRSCRKNRKLFEFRLTLPFSVAADNAPPVSLLPDGHIA